MGCGRQAQREDRRGGLRHPPGGRAQRRRAQAPGAGPAAEQRGGHPAARRAGQLPRHPHPAVVGGPAEGVPQHDPDGQPRPHPAGARRHEGGGDRGGGRVGARRLLRHVPGGSGPPPGTAGRRLEALARRGAPPLPPHEDHEAAGRAELQERHQGQRRGDPVGEVRGRRPAAPARAGPADQGAPARGGLRPAGGPDARRQRGRPVPAVQRRGPLRRATRPDRPQRHRQDAPAGRPGRHHPG